MKPIYWGLILAYIVVVGFYWYSHLKRGEAPTTPALIEESQKENLTSPQPEIPQLESFEGLEKESQAIETPLAPNPSE